MTNEQIIAALMTQVDVDLEVEFTHSGDEKTGQVRGWVVDAFTVEVTDANLDVETFFVKPSEITVIREA